MTCLDADVIVSYINDEDYLRIKAPKLVNSLNKRTISKLVILELYSAFSRVSGARGLELGALAGYSVESTRSELKDVELRKFINKAEDVGSIARYNSLNDG